MKRHVIAVLTVLFFLSGAFALTLNVKTIPGVITPGTSGKMIFEISATSGARNIEMRVGPSDVFSIEDEGQRIDVGDVMGGTVSYVLWFHVPETINPGVYVLPVEITYDDPSTGQSYTEHFAPILTVTSGKGVEVELPEKVYGNTEQTMKISIKNSGADIYNAVLSVPDALGDSEIFIGDLKSGETKDIYVKVLPSCEKGTYTFSLAITGYQGAEKINETINYTVKCIPPSEDLQVTLNIPEKIGGGEQNTSLVIFNGTSVAQGPITVTITGVNIRLGGQTSHYINSIAPGSKLTIPVIWKLQKSDEPGEIDVILSTPSGERRYSFSVLPEDEPEISVFVSDKPVWEGDTLKVVLSVANLGAGTAENVFVETNSPKAYGGKQLIGDLAPGDYDTVTVYLTNPEGEEKIHATVEYTTYGQKKTEEFEITVKVPPKPQNGILWIVIVAAIAVGIWWWRRKRK